MVRFTTFTPGGEHHTIAALAFFSVFALKFRDETNAAKNSQSKKFTALFCALGLISIVAIYPRQTVNFFWSTAIQIKDYIHFYGYRPVKSFAIRIPANYTIHGIDVSRWQARIDWQRVAKMRDNGIRLQFAFIKATEGEKLVDPYFSRNWRQSHKMAYCAGHITIFLRRSQLPFRRDYFCKRWISHKAICQRCWT